MWRTTGDVKWRERGYRIYQAIEKHTRTKYGYTSIRGVNKQDVEKLDDMPRLFLFLFFFSFLFLFFSVTNPSIVFSWFLAETLKYLYLLFDDTNSYPLDRWVFNTEAHPLPVFSWTQKEREAFGMD